jgi:hypothetical protein
VEQFETDDPAWLPTCAVENERRSTVAPWWRHERHPKHYLDHLLDRSGAGPYLETSADAVRALADVAWAAHGSADGCFARSLFEDLAQWFGVANPMGPGTCAPATWPGPKVKPGSLVLRNL